MQLTLQDIFEQIENSELRHLYVGEANAGSIATADYPKIISHLNLGLIELYKRFSLKTRELTLQLYSHITLYKLHNDFADSDPNTSGEPYKYILDAHLEPEYRFTNDILFILNVFNEIGNEFPMNDIDVETSIYTPEPNVIQMNYPDSENTISIIYRATPVKVPTNTTDLTYEVPLPSQFLESISAFIGYREHVGRGVGETNPEASFWFGQFLQAAGLIKHMGTYQQDTTVNMRFADNGWK